MGAAEHKELQSFSREILLANRFCLAADDLVKANSTKVDQSAWTHLALASSNKRLLLIDVHTHVKQDGYTMRGQEARFIP